MNLVTGVILKETVPVEGLRISNTFRKLSNLFRGKQSEFRAMSTNVATIKNTLKNGIPVVVGMGFDELIYAYNNNIDIPMSLNPAGVMNHFVTIVGYRADSTFTAMNSFSANSGRNGAFVFEQEYSGIFRCFVIREVTADAPDIPENLPTIPV